MTKIMSKNPQGNQDLELSFCDRRVRFFCRVLKGVLILAGGILSISQVVHIVGNFPGSLSQWLGLGVGLGILVMGFYARLDRAVKQLVLRNSLQDKLIVWAVPLAMSALIVGVYFLVGRRSFKAMSEEGGIFEYGTFVMFLVAAIFAVPVARYLWSQKQRVLGAMYGAFAALLGMVAFEEISWGQMLFGFESPEFFNENNSQSEITLHNMDSIHDAIDPILIVVGLLGAFAWFFLGPLSHSPNRLLKGIYRYFVPSWYLSSYFLLMSIVTALIKYAKSIYYSVRVYGEASELIFSIGFLLLVLTGFFRQCFLDYGEK